MSKYLTCSQVLSLINFYIEDKLNPKLAEYVKLHIIDCPHCKKKFQELLDILNQNKTYKLNKNDKNDEKNLSSEFINNLSAYVDRELNSEENIKIKKQTVSNPDARRELEYMYKFQKLIQSAYEKTKNDYKTDYSKSVISKICNENYYTTTYFKKIIILFCIIILVILSGLAYLYF